MKTRPAIYHALSRNVLCVAVTNDDGSWEAFCNAVAGRSHDDEMEDVLNSGIRMRKEIARAVFPRFAERHYRT